MLVTVLISVLVTLLASFPLGIATGVLAEQSASTPESGAISRIKAIYDSLVTLGYGSDTASGWGDWGAMWNRIRSAAEWTPDGTASTDDVLAGEIFYAGSRSPLTGTLALSGDALVSDVASGKTFYSNSLTQLTGTAPAPFDYSLQSLATMDDYGGTYHGEESEWVGISGSPFSEYADFSLESGVVKQDTRTGLIWTVSSTSTLSNEFTLASDGERPTGGNAIAFCEALNTGTYGGIDSWYLPTQKELMQAYLDGIYSQDVSFGGENYFWSSSAVSDFADSAWYMEFQFGFVDYDWMSNGAEYSVRCVARE